MSTPKIKVAIITVIGIITASLFLFIIHINVYDYNYYHFLQNIFFKNEKNILEEKHYILNIEDPVSSSVFENMLYYISDNDPSYIVIDNNFTKLKDLSALNKINGFIESYDKIFTSIKVTNKKGIPIPFLRYYSNSEELIKKTHYLKSSSAFSFAHYLDDLRFPSDLRFPADRTGFFSDQKTTLNKGSLDILYKFEKKYGLNLPYLIYLDERGIDLEKQQFGLLKANLSDTKTLYFDQKGRCGLSTLTGYNGSLNVFNFNEWSANLPQRSAIIENLIYLEQFSPKKAGYEKYKNEKTVISKAYELTSIDDENKNTVLERTKQMVTEWNSFSKATSKSLSGSAVFIVQEGNYEWIDNYLAEKESIRLSTTLFRFPIMAAYIVILLFFILILLLTAFFSRASGIAAAVLLILAAGIGNICLRFLLFVDTPFISLAIALPIAVVSGFFLRLFTQIIWEQEVYHIYKQNISRKFKKLIAKSWPYSRDLFDMKSKLATFMSIDISAFIKSDYQRNEVESISSRTTHIENTIKNNFGIINAASPSHISSYYGNPAIRSTPVHDAINTGHMILSSEQNKQNDKDGPSLIIALHSKYEWFKFIKNKKEKYYTNFGTSPVILDAMIRVAKNFKLNFIVSDNIYKLSKGTLKVRMLNRIKIPAIDVSIRTFELLNTKQIETFGKLPDFFHAGLKLFESKQFEEASYYFKQCLKIVPEDIPSEVYLQRCKDFVYIPPQEEWDGSYIID